MMWLDIAMIVFSVTAANHMGLVDAMEKTIGIELPVVNCCKCGSFWATLIYGFFLHPSMGMIAIVAISFLAALCAVWLELLMGFIDTKYYKAYERIYDTSAFAEADGNKDNTEAGDKDDTTSTLPKV